MTKNLEWLKVFAIIIFMMLLGGYYDRFSVETRTMILPLAIFIAATSFFVYLRKIQYEMRVSNVIAYKLVVHELSMVDSAGKERISVSSDDGVITFYDENHEALVRVEAIDKRTVLRLKAEEGSAELTLDPEGKTSLTLRGKTNDILWSAP